MHRTLILLSLAVCAGLQAQVAVLNGASNRTDQPVTRGSWATAYGTFAQVTQTVAPGYPIPKTLGGVTVTVDGVEAPVYFVSAAQINFLIPYQTTPGLKPLQIRTAGGTISGNVRVMAAAPGLFIKEAANAQPPKGAILNQDSTENTSSNVARRGQVIQIYATGPGLLNQSITDGAGAPSSPLVTTVSKPEVHIAGVKADVQFSGLAPNFAGLWQINAAIPERPFIAGRVPVQVFMDGVDSNEVSIFVAQ